MANHKDILKQALNELPVGFAELLETATIPAASEITSPASVEDALIACGKTAKYINAILAKLGGLPLLQVPLRVGQLNPSTQILAVAGLEFVGSTLHDMEILTPQSDTNIQSGVDVTFSCQISGGVDVVDVRYEALTWPVQGGELVSGYLVSSDGGNYFSHIFGVLGDGAWGFQFRARFLVDGNNYEVIKTTSFHVGNPS